MRNCEEKKEIERLLSRIAELELVAKEMLNAIKEEDEFGVDIDWQHFKEWRKIVYANESKGETKHGR